MTLTLFTLRRIWYGAYTFALPILLFYFYGHVRIIILNEDTVNTIQLRFFFYDRVSTHIWQCTYLLSERELANLHGVINGVGYQGLRSVLMHLILIFQVADLLRSMDIVLYNRAEFRRAHCPDPTRARHRKLHYNHNRWNGFMALYV